MWPVCGMSRILHATNSTSSECEATETVWRMSWPLEQCSVSSQIHVNTIFAQWWQSAIGKVIKCLLRPRELRLGCSQNTVTFRHPCAGGRGHDKDKPKMVTQMKISVSVEIVFTTFVCRKKEEEAPRIKCCKKRKKYKFVYYVVVSETRRDMKTKRRKKWPYKSIPLTRYLRDCNPLFIYQRFAQEPHRKRPREQPESVFMCDRVSVAARVCVCEEIGWNTRRTTGETIKVQHT